MNPLTSPALSNRRQMLQHLALGLAATAAGGFAAASAQAHEDAPQSGVKVTKLRTEPLDGQADVAVTIVQLDFAPGAESKPHRHPGQVFVYVISGTVEAQIKDGPLMTLHAGDTFYEPVGAVHTVARNPSATESAKAVVFMLGKKDAALATPA